MRGRFFNCFGPENVVPGMQCPVSYFKTIIHLAYSWNTTDCHVNTRAPMVVNTRRTVLVQLIDSLI
jgi:hypothetical protein